jgi:hypothetical protein
MARTRGEKMSESFGRKFPRFIKEIKFMAQLRAACGRFWIKKRSGRGAKVFMMNLLLYCATKSCWAALLARNERYK